MQKYFAHDLKSPNGTLCSNFLFKMYKTILADVLKNVVNMIALYSRPRSNTTTTRSNPTPENQLSMPLVG